MVLDKEDVIKIVYLVCIQVDDVDILVIFECLFLILGMIEQLQVVFIDGIELMVYFIDVVQCLCEDVVIE